MKSLLLSVLSVACLSANAQTFELKHNGRILNDGDIVIVSETYQEFDNLKIKFKLDVKNISTDSYSMRMKKEVIDAAPNTSNTMCWDMCVTPGDIYATCANIGPGSTEFPYGEVTLDYDGDAVDGTTIVNYTFMTSNKQDPAITVEVHYVYDISGVENTKPGESLTITTARNSIEIICPRALKTFIYDITGQIVRELSLTEGINVINDLPKGFYIIENKKIKL